MKMNKKIPIVIALIALFAVSSISLAFGQTTSGTPSMMTPTATNSIAQRSFIRINGIITGWDFAPPGSKVSGMLQTQARVGIFENGNINQLATATAIWTNSSTRPINAFASKENFTNTFHEARLWNASISKLTVGTSSTDYILVGTWNVWTVVNTVTIHTDDATGQITSIHRTMDKSVQRATGTLTVTANWSKFALSISATGIGTLSGTVIRYMQRQVEFNPFKVTEDTTTNAVTRADVAQVIRSYGAMPGWGNYDSKMDFCGHYKIDIADLSTVASKL
jgi:hypothetical protein